MCSRGKIQQRFVLAIMNLLGLSLGYHFRTVFSAALPEMVYRNKSNGTEVTLLEPHCGDKFDWDENSQGILLSSFYWGYMFTPIIGGIIADKCGGKHVFGVTVALSAIAVILHPTAARAGYGWLLALRIVFGFIQGPLYSSLASLMSQWVPQEERSVYGGIVYSGVQLGTVSANLITGALLTMYADDWSTTFYFSGILGLLWYILFCLLCSNSPEDHPFIGDAEKKYLRNNVIKNGLMSSLPFLVMWMVSILAGLISHKIISNFKWTITVARKIFASFSMLCPIAGLLGAAYLDFNPTAAVISLCLGLGGLGALNVGIELIPNDISPNFAGTIQAISSLFVGLSGIIAPYLVGVIAPNQTAEEWRIILFISAGIAFATLVIFNLLASGHVQPWNDVTTDKTITSIESTVSYY